MPKLIHRLLCNVSQRYRARHCRHVDELPERIQRKLRESCREMDPRSWNDAHQMMRDLLADIDAEDQETRPSSFGKAAAVFA